MSNFGFISPLLAPGRHPAWKSLMALFPGWAHFFPVQPKAVGDITGSLFDMPVRGYGFSTPELPIPAWNDSRITLFWDRFYKDLQQREIAVVGMDQGAPQPPAQISEAPDFPGISDGKALELLLFNQNFDRILDHYEIKPPKATATIIWEEGNLGLTCARLIAQELRFLTLVHPNLRILEQAAEVIRAETGLAPRIFTEIPSNYRELGIIIRCGQFKEYHGLKSFERNPRYHLFGANAALHGPSFNLSVTMGARPEGALVYLALGEAIFRACFDLDRGIWYGPQLPLTRVLELERVYKTNRTAD